MPAAAAAPLPARIARGHAPSAPSQPLRVVARALARWEARARSRAQLRGMAAERLRDVGLTRADALREGAKPFWRG